MRVWRITRLVHAASPLSGEGAARSGRRWNSAGVPMGYTSTHRALAILEMLVHVTRDTTPADAVILPIDVPDELISELDPWPQDWNQLPYGKLARLAGDAWIRSKASLGLLVPSVVLASERNLLVNPTHPEFKRIVVHAPELAPFDRRLLK